MSDNTLAVLLLIATVSLWIALPLLPAMLIYHYFPDTPAGLKGPLQGLSLSAGGAFAAYFSTLLVLGLGVNQIIAAIRVPPQSMWSLDASLVMHDENGREIPTPKDISIAWDPAPVHVFGDRLSADIVKSKDGWPKFQIDAGEMGATTVVLDPAKIDFDVDKDNYRIRIKEPLIIRRPRPAAAGNAKLFAAAARAQPSADGAAVQ